MKKNQSNSRAEKYKDWTEKFNRELQQQSWSSRRISRLRQIIWNYPVKKKKENKWKAYIKKERKESLQYLWDTI